ncbi:hypothetical protein M514_00391 [Trichuris suis]|uniref:Uncharacterized protein n=2 Tax=Trichuris suis TaxID=68888 RepID=A0A085NR85_9BILA|nr:hypothetical protein M514_00391 [Trichuris suis]
MTDPHKLHKGQFFAHKRTKTMRRLATEPLKSDHTLWVVNTAQMAPPEMRSRSLHNSSNLDCSTTTATTTTTALVSSSYSIIGPNNLYKSLPLASGCSSGTNDTYSLDKGARRAQLSTQCFKTHHPLDIRSLESNCPPAEGSEEEKHVWQKLPAVPPVLNNPWNDHYSALTSLWANHSGGVSLRRDTMTSCDQTKPANLPCKCESPKGDSVASAVSSSVCHFDSDCYDESSSSSSNASVDKVQKSRERTSKRRKQRLSANRKRCRLKATEKRNRKANLLFDGSSGESDEVSPPKKTALRKKRRREWAIYLSEGDPAQPSPVLEERKGGEEEEEEEELPLEEETGKAKCQTIGFQNYHSVIHCVRANNVVVNEEDASVFRDFWNPSIESSCELLIMEKSKKSEFHSETFTLKEKANLLAMQAPDASADEAKANKPTLPSGNCPEQMIATLEECTKACDGLAVSAANTGEWSENEDVESTDSKHFADARENLDPKEFFTDTTEAVNHEFASTFPSASTGGSASVETACDHVQMQPDDGGTIRDQIERTCQDIMQNVSGIFDIVEKIKSAACKQTYFVDDDIFKPKASTESSPRWQRSFDKHQSLQRPESSADAEMINLLRLGEELEHQFLHPIDQSESSVSLHRRLSLGSKSDRALSSQGSNSNERKQKGPKETASVSLDCPPKNTLSTFKSSALSSLSSEEFLARKMAAVIGNSRNSDSAQTSSNLLSRPRRTSLEEATKRVDELLRAAALRQKRHMMMCASGRRSVTRGPSSSEAKFRWNLYRSQQWDERRGAHRSASELKQTFGNESSSVSFSSTPKSLTTQNGRSFTMERLDFTRRWLDGNLSMFESEDKGNSGLSDFEAKRNIDTDLQSVGSASEEVAAITDHQDFEHLENRIALSSSPVSFTEGYLKKCMQKPIANKEPAVRSSPNEMPAVWCKRTDLQILRPTNDRSHSSPVSARSYPCSMPTHGRAHASQCKSRASVEPCFDSDQSAPSVDPSKDNRADRKRSKRFSVTLNVEGIIRMFNEKHKKSNGLKVMLVKKANHEKPCNLPSTHETICPSTANAIQPIACTKKVKGTAFSGSNCQAKELASDSKRERMMDVVLVAPWASTLPNDAESSSSITGCSGKCRQLCAVKDLKTSETSPLDEAKPTEKDPDSIHDLYDLIHGFDNENIEFTEPKFPINTGPVVVTTPQLNNNHPINDAQSFKPTNDAVKRKTFKPVHRTKQTNFYNGMDCSVCSDQLMVDFGNCNRCLYDSASPSSRSAGQIGAAMSASTVEPIWQPCESKTLEKEAQCEEKHYDNLECGDVPELLAQKKLTDLTTNANIQQVDPPCSSISATCSNEGPWMRQESVTKSESDNFEKKHLFHTAHCAMDCSKAATPSNLHYSKQSQSEALATSGSCCLPVGLQPVDAKESTSKSGATPRPKANSLPRYLMRSLLTKLMASNSTKHLKQSKPIFCDVLSLSLVNVTSDLSSRELQIRKSTSSALPSSQQVESSSTATKLLPWQQTSYSYPSSKSLHAAKLFYNLI